MIFPATVVITTKNRKEDLRRALKSVFAQSVPLEVLVMDEDPAVRGNRLRLLLDVRDTLGRLGDFSQIPR